MKYRSVLSLRKNAQNAPATPKTIITPITQIFVGNKMELANAVFLQGSQLLYWPDSIKTNTFKPPLFICLFIFPGY